MTATDLHPDTREPRPGTCCGACPPIAGGGWDCTCAGNPRCSVSAPAAEWEDLARLAKAFPAHECIWHVHEMGKVFVGSGDPRSLSTIVHMSADDLADLTEESAQEARRNGAWIAAANPATILRLIRELQQQRHRTAEFQTIAAEWANRAVAAEERLAAVEAFLDETDRRRSEEWGLPLYGNTKVLTGEVRAALAAPTDTTKEN